jgi:hypothetical protein
MPGSLNSGWTAASLLPSIAAGFSPGASVASRLAPAQVSGNPRGQMQALSMANFHQDLIRRILGQKQPVAANPVSQLVAQPVKTPGINPAVNNLTNAF